MSPYKLDKNTTLKKIERLMKSCLYPFLKDQISYQEQEKRQGKCHYYFSCSLCFLRFTTIIAPVQGVSCIYQAFYRILKFCFYLSYIFVCFSHIGNCKKRKAR